MTSWRAPSRASRCSSGSDVSGWQPIGGFAATPRDEPATVDELEGYVWLALRQCATHPAGPLRTIATLHKALQNGLGAFSLLDIENRIRCRMDEGELTDDRREVSEAFITVVFAGLHALEERGEYGRRS